MNRWILLTITLLFSSAALAVVETFEFDSEQQRKRYNVFIEELRCPKCQNQNLSGSNSPIAADLRRELYRMIQEGQSDDAIVDFMVSRYGEFVLYRPRLDENTIILWLAPVLFVLIGVGTALIVIYRHRKAAVGPASLSAEEQARLKALLDEEADD